MFYTKYWVVLVDFNLSFFQERVDTPNVVIGGLLEKLFVLHVLEKTEEVRLIDEPIAVHVKNVESKLLGQGHHVEVLLGLTYYLFLQLPVEQSIVHGNAEIKEANQFSCQPRRVRVSEKPL